MLFDLGWCFFVWFWGGFVFDGVFGSGVVGWGLKEGVGFKVGDGGGGVGDVFCLVEEGYVLVLGFGFV